MASDGPTKSLEELAQETGKYPAEAFRFVREGLQFTVERLHGKECCEPCHIRGSDLCWGLRDLAIKRWGLMASAVLRSWEITKTEDFGEVVFSMVSAGWMAKSDQDSPADFVAVYDFHEAFDNAADIIK